MTGDADLKADAGDTVRFGGYVAGRELGSGGMGTVFEARHPTLGKRVALKVIKGSLTGDPVAHERFRREARAIALVSHPHVVDVFDLGIDDGRAFIVMELLEGETLEALLARKQRLALSHAIDLLLPVISAAAAIHETGVVHRDLKPGNVMLARRGRFALEPVVLDFGISRAPDASAAQATLTEPHLLVGTLPYLSPEQLRDARAAGPQSDQYALGVMLYECVTGKKPFTGADRYELMHATMTAAVTPPSRVVADLPAGFDQVILRALDRKPESRFPSVRALGAALLSYADRAAWKRWANEFAGVDRDADSLVAGETAADIRALPPPGRHGAARRTIWLSLAAGALAIGVVALAARSNPKATPPTMVAAPPPEPVAPAATAPATIPPAPIPPTSVDSPRDVSPRVTKRAPTVQVRRTLATSPTASPVRADAPLRETPATAPGKPADHAQVDDAIDPFAPVR